MSQNNYSNGNKEHEIIIVTLTKQTTKQNQPNQQQTKRTNKQTIKKIIQFVILKYAYIKISAMPS